MKLYEPTIKTLLTDIQMQLEGEILKAVQNVGIVVDKEELLKALKYDRDQYDKGYADGTAAIERVLERLESLCEMSMRNSEKAAELGKSYEKHMILQGAKGVAYETAIEIIKEEIERE